MKYSLGYNTKDKRDGPYTMDHWRHYTKIKYARMYVKYLKDNGLLENQYVILKETLKGITQMY